VCAIDRHTPRNGRVLEELGTYDTSIADTDARAILKNDRIDYWLGVGAQPSDRVATLIKKYGSQGTHRDQQQQALRQLEAPKPIADPGPPASLPKETKEAKATEADPSPQTPEKQPPKEKAEKSPEEAAPVETSKPQQEEAGGEKAASE